MRTVLCVSDEWSLRFDDLRALADSGFTVVTATTGNQALKRFSAGNVDAVLVNRRLGDMDVDDFAWQLKSQCPYLPVIMLSREMPKSGQTSNCIDAVLACNLTTGLLVPTIEVLLTTPNWQEAAGDTVPLAA